MKKLFVLLLVIGIGTFSGKLSAQENRDAKTQEAKKGGFAVGGFDASIKETKNVKRSVNMNEEAEVSEKALMEEAMPPAPPVEAMPAQAPAPAPDDFGKARSQDVKDKQKPKKNSKSKGRRR